MPKRRSAAIALGVTVAATLFAAPAAAHEPAASDDIAPFAVTTLASRLDIPWDFGFLPDGSGIFTERDTRRIKQIKGTTVTTITTISEASTTGGEGGLLGLAVSPRYSSDKTLFIYYSTGSDNRVASLVIGQRPKPIVTGIPRNRYHNGGGLEFGPDGYLYISTGDGQNASNAQNRNSLGGKILRVTTSGAAAPGNPFPGSRVYSLGHRNVQGMAWANGRMYATEFGNAKTDELNQILPGRNYAWPICEGPCGDSRFVNPVRSWGTKECGPAGLVFHRGALYIGAVTGKRLWRIPVTASGVGTPQAQYVGTYGRLRSVISAPDGSLWVGTSNQDNNGSPGASDDRILKIT